jgi:hypothetical protein
LAYHRIRQTVAKLRDTEQQGGKAEYGVRLLEHLSEALQRKLGSGFSMCNLRNMHRFYLRNRIQQPAAELNWSQQPLQRYGVIAPDRMARSKGTVIDGGGNYSF